MFNVSVDHVDNVHDDVSTCSEVIDLRSHKCPLSGLGGPIV